MPTRQIAYPNVSVEPAQGSDTEIQFVVPGSKFGGVVVILDAKQIQALVAALSLSPAPEQEKTNG